MLLCKEAEVFPELQIRHAYYGQQSQGAEEKPTKEPNGSPSTGYKTAVGATHQSQNQKREEDFHGI